MVLGFTGTASLERKQYHYFLGINVADGGRIRITQSGDALPSESTWKTSKKSPLMLKWQRLTAVSKLRNTSQKCDSAI